MREQSTIFEVPFDDETVELLLEAAVECRCHPKELIASIVRDVLADDAKEHGREKPPRHMMN